MADSSNATDYHSPTMERKSPTMGLIDPRSSKRIYCTLVMQGDDYIPGAIVLAESLHTVKTRYEIWCMIDNTVSIDGVRMLDRYFDRVIRVHIIQHESMKYRSKLLQSRYGSWIDKSYTKWHIFNPRTFSPDIVDKVMFIDADTIVLEDIDFLFDLNPPAATFVSPWSTPYSKSGYNPYGSLRHGAIIPKLRLQDGLKSAFVGGGSMVLIRPSAKIWNIFEQILNSSEVYGNEGCKVGVDEQILAQTFDEAGAVFRNIHQQYNWAVGYTNLFLHGEKPKVYHYMSAKPWTLKAYIMGKIVVVTDEQRRDADRIITLHKGGFFEPWFNLAKAIGERDPEFRKYFI